MGLSVEEVVPVGGIDAAWMTEVLRASGLLGDGAQVSGVSAETCGTGQLADSYRFDLTYDGDGSGPPSVVGKFASEDAASREFGQQSGYYRNEIRFYQELAPTLKMAIPTPVHAALAADQTEFVLLMEDLTPARIVDQITGCSADEAALTVEQAAALHAGSWHDDALGQTEWLGGTSASFSHVTDNFGQTIADFPGLAGDLVPEADIAEAAKLVDHLDTWKQVFTAPQCLWHSDLRADNLLFDAQDGARPIAVLDWQGVGYARGTIDVAYFMGTSLPTELRREQERDLVTHYHEALVAAGVSGYDADECWEDYRLLAIHALQVGIFGLGAVRRSERGDEMWRVWIERAAAHVRDLDSYAVLAGR